MGQYKFSISSVQGAHLLIRTSQYKDSTRTVQGQYKDSTRTVQGQYKDSTRTVQGGKRYPTDGYVQGGKKI
jgi:hypothetical protein